MGRFSWPPFPVFADLIAARGDRRWQVGRRMVVYGGGESQSRSQGDLVSWTEFDQALQGPFL